MVGRRRHCHRGLLFIRGLVGGAQVANVALLLFVGALVIEAHEARQNLAVGQSGGPAVSLGYGGIELLVQAEDHGGQALLVYGLVLWCEGQGGAQRQSGRAEEGNERGGGRRWCRAEEGDGRRDRWKVPCPLAILMIRAMNHFFVTYR